MKKTHISFKIFAFYFFIFNFNYGEESIKNVKDTDEFEIFLNSIYEDLNYNNSDKKNDISSNILNIDRQIIFKSLYTLVSSKSNNLNAYDPKLSNTKIEIELHHKPKVDSVIHKKGIIDLKYSIFHKYSNNPDTSILMVHNNTTLVNNNTIINEKNSESFSIKIYFEYLTDKNYLTRLNKLSKENLEQIYSSYSPLMIFRQGVDFKMRKINFTETLNPPKIINIWIKNSNQLYPCELVKNQLENGDDYLISYTCKALPNINDYGKELKILFD